MLRSPRVQLQKAEKLVGKGKLDAALKIYEKVLQEEHSDSGTLNKAGDLYVRLNRIDKAIELFSRTAGFFIEEQLFVKAIAIYKKILRLEPSRLDIATKLAATYISQGLINDATYQYGEIAAQYMSQGDVETALAVHHTMVGAIPKDPSARLRYAELLEEHNKLKESMSQYRQLARVLLEEGGTDEAVKVLLRGVQVLPESLDFIEQAARDLLTSNGKEAAESFLTQAADYNSGAVNVDLGSAGSPSDLSPAAAPAGKFEATASEVLDLDDPIAPIDPMAPINFIDSDSTANSTAEPQVSTSGEDSDDLVFELDMTDLESDYAVDQPVTPLSRPAKADADSQLAQLVKEQAAKPDADIPVRVLSDREKRVAELVNEAEVLIRFGMDEKAVERLELALTEDSTHLVTFERLIDSYLKLKQMEKVPSLANRMSVAASEQEVPQAFESVLGRILEAGFKFEGGEFIAPVSHSIDEVLGEDSSEDLDIETDRVVEDLVIQLAEEHSAAAIDDQSTISEDLSVVTWLGEEALVEAVSAEVDLILPTVEAVPTDVDLAEPVEVAAELDLESEEQFAEMDLTPGSDDEVDPDPDVEAVSEILELALPNEQPGKPASDLIDIAEELMRELDDEDAQQESAEEAEEEEDDRLIATVATEEESLEDIVRGFREGVDATLSPEDYDTHFNLGIAYREMGLIDEAIGEFQLASKDLRYLIKGCSLLALSYLDKGLPGLAMTAYQLALESKTATEMESIGLRYEIGDLYLTMGDPEAAKDYFVQIYGTDSKYRDVAQKLNEIERAL